MAEAIARAVTLALGLYAAVGLVFALAFAARGASRLDPAAREGTLGFRIAIVPGAAAFWPLLLRRWLRGDVAQPDERNAHRQAAR
jgi:hypothetical protein